MRCEGTWTGEKYNGPAPIISPLAPPLSPRQPQNVCSGIVSTRVIVRFQICDNIYTTALDDFEPLAIIAVAVTQLTFRCPDGCLYIVVLGQLTLLVLYLHSICNLTNWVGVKYLLL